VDEADDEDELVRIVLHDGDKDPPPATVMGANARAVDSARHRTRQRK
jgi:hypothetical protein